MAVRIFKAMTVGATLTEADSYPVNIKTLSVRGVAILPTAGTGTITIKFKDGLNINTPRIPANTPYEALYESEIDSIVSINGLITFDIELLKLGVS